jgi:hypothetical protein
MLIFLRHRLTFLATPKTGTTAVELALRPRAEIIFARNRKHLTAQRYQNRVAPFLAQTFGVSPETVAVLRDPVAQIRSWYRYRNAERLNGTEFSAAGMSFDDFVLGVIAADPPPPAQIGSQFAFLTDDTGALLVDHLFAYESQPRFRDFMAERLGTKADFKPKNVSPDLDAPLSAEVEAQLRAARADEFALHDRLRAAGGYLHTPLTD